MAKILPFVDVVVGNEEDCFDVLGIRAGDTDVHSGALETGRYPDVARQVVKLFPNVSKVAITLRESLSATHNNWGAMLYVAADDKPSFAPGLIFALTQGSEPQAALDFAVAASCLKHSIK